MKAEVKKKSMWGVGLFVANGAFIVGILALVYFAMSQKVDLVSEQYYDQGIHYQERIAAIENTRGLKEKPMMTVRRDELTVQFPRDLAQRNIAGTITLYRPDNKGRDRTLDILLDSAACQHIAFASLAHGLWKAKVEWSADSVEYYTEQPVIIP